MAIELDDCVLLVECKATAPSQENATANSLLKSSAFGRIVDGVEQLSQTGIRIAEGRLDATGFDTKKPRYALVAVMGRFPAANHDRSWTELETRLSQRGIRDLSRIFAGRPQVFDAFALETFIIGVNQRRFRAATFLEANLGSSTIAASGWQNEIAKLLQGIDQASKSFWTIPGDEALGEWASMKPNRS